MGQIVRSKKKGRPSKADLAAEKKAAAAAAASEKELRRSGRRRNVRCTFDFDDYLFDDEDEDEQGREKKLKLLLKLHAAADDSPPSPPPRRPPPTSAAYSSPSCSADDDDDVTKRRKIDDEVDYENEEFEDGDNQNEFDFNSVEVKGRKRDEGRNEVDSAPGTPLESPSGFPLPDKKDLEVILEKLEKKDRYRVYAKPVDPEELPDYHDVIKHPMDFATIRSKLANGSYTTLDQFESDVFLLCSNAMQYNAPDTVFYKQARSIQELAKKKFEILKVGHEPSEKELMLEEKPKSISTVKKQIKKPLSRTLQEPVGSDFSTGATLATMADIQNCSSAVQADGTGKPSSLDGLDEGNVSVIDTSLDKAEESLPGKSSLSRIGRKVSVPDENRRATYFNSIQPLASSESIFSTFDDEVKELIPVGLYVDHAYARSLARFAGSLGPVAWKVASKRIEQILPSGTKFGRGWVGEYEQLPTPFVVLENCTIREPAFFRNPQHIGDARNNKMYMASVASANSSVSGPTLGGKSPHFSPAGITPTSCSATNQPSAKEPPFRGTSFGDRQSFFSSPEPTIAGYASLNLQPQNSQTRHLMESQKKVLKQVELNRPPATSQPFAHLGVEGQVCNATEALTPRSLEMVSMNRDLRPSGSFKQPNITGVAVKALPNGNVISNSSDGNRGFSSSSGMGMAGTSFPRGQEQALTDPVELMRMLSEKNGNQQKFANQSAVSSPPVPSQAQSLNRDDSGNAAAAAARVWMSIGAAGFRPSSENINPQKNQISANSLYNQGSNLQSQVSRFRGDNFQPERNSFPLHGYVSEPGRLGNAAHQFQNQPMLFPQSLTTDLSRFQMHSPWRSFSHQNQQGQKQEILPPDLNVSFQSSGSPGRPSSGMLVDSQQPDLALQL